MASYLLYHEVGYLHQYLMDPQGFWDQWQLRSMDGCSLASSAKAHAIEQLALNRGKLEKLVVDYESFRNFADGSYSRLQTSFA